jgi:hypothetical protein
MEVIVVSSPVKITLRDAQSIASDFSDGIS